MKCWDTPKKAIPAYGTQHVTQSIATVGVYAAPSVFPPNFGVGIGVTKDGVDITVPVAWSNSLRGRFEVD